jgi:hypothetical protein
MAAVWAAVMVANFCVRKSSIGAHISMVAPSPSIPPARRGAFGESATMLMGAPMLDFLTQKFATITTAPSAAVEAAEQHFTHALHATVFS